MKPLHVTTVLALAGVFFFDSLVLPLMPDAFFRFLERAFGLHGWTQIVAFNDLFGMFAGLYFIGLIEAVRAFVLPREENFLSLVLAKPISRAKYVRMQIVPVFAGLCAMGGILSLVLVLKLAWINGLDGLGAGSVLSMGISATLLAVGLCAIATVLCLIVRDTYTAVLLGFLLFSVIAIPAGGYMHRPDLYAGNALAANLLVFPANVLWFHATLPEKLPAFTLTAVAVLSIAFAACVAWIQSTDID